MNSTIPASRLVITRDHERETISVALRPDWRGMNAHSLGVWRFPLDDAARARLIELGVDPADVAPRYCATCGEREGSEYAKHCCTPDNMIED